MNQTIAAKRSGYHGLKITRTVFGTAGILGRLLVCLIFAFPFYWMIITSVKTYRESILFPPTLWPQNFSLQGFITVFTQLDLGLYLRNSIIIIVCIMAIQLVIMVPAAYAFAKYNFRFKSAMFALVLIANMTPTVITFIPVYIMFAKVDLFGVKLLATLLPQILPFGANAFGIFLLRQSFMQIPEEVIESARLDNAKELRIMTRIMIPMSKSTLVTVSMFSFISHWNAYFWPLVMCTTENVKPIILAIAGLKDVDQGLMWPTIMAGNTLVVLPILIMFALASRQIIASMAYRGVK
jgi:sn-glycerol 3-phosphate transport system permease protein